MAEQSYSSHMKFFPPFHFFVLPVFGINFGFSVYWWWKAGFSLAGAVGVVVAAANMVGIN